jgi:NTP-dependent ternary system trypsin peptidase co-occuring protein
MSDMIRAGTGSIGAPMPEPAPSRRLVPIQVGKAIVYIEQIGEPVIIEADDRIHPVAPDTKEVFENAVEVLQQCVHVVGEKVETIVEKIRPQEITVEFTLSFEATGKIAVIPILVTGETKGSTGLKVTAVWK